MILDSIIGGKLMGFGESRLVREGNKLSFLMERCNGVDAKINFSSGLARYFLP